MEGVRRDGELVAEEEEEAGERMGEAEAEEDIKEEEDFECLDEEEGVGEVVKVAWGRAGGAALSPTREVVGEGLKEEEEEAEEGVVVVGLALREEPVERRVGEGVRELEG